MGPHVRVVLEEAARISGIWRCIHEAKPTDHWFASGYRVVELHSADGRVARLFVNESGGAFVEGADRFHYDAEVGRMVGLEDTGPLHEIVMRALNHAAAAE